MSGTSSNAKQKGSRRANGFKDFSGSWQGFVDLPLTDDDKERLSALAVDDFPDMGDFLADVLADGYKVSLVIDEKHSCCIATLTGRGSGCVNAGFSLSARGPDLQRSLLVLYYKHVTLCECGRWEGHQSASTNQLSLWG